MYIFFQVEELYCELNYHDQKNQRTPVSLLGRRGPGGDLVLCKEYTCNLQDTLG